MKPASDHVGVVSRRSAARRILSFALISSPVESRFTYGFSAGTREVPRQRSTADGIVRPETPSTGAIRLRGADRDHKHVPGIW
jgi:hypothetical protein